MTSLTYQQNKILSIFYILCSRKSNQQECHVGKISILLIGILGIWVSFILCGVIIQLITTSSYINIVNDQSQKYISTSGLIAYQKIIIWITAVIWNYFTIPASQLKRKQMKYVQLTGFLLFVSSFANLSSLAYISYPIFNIFRSLNVLVVILVGVLCSRVIKKEYKLKPEKIIVGVLIMVGIVVYKYYDPQTQENTQSQKKTHLIGVLLVMVSLVVDGFAPDYQAKIKQEYNPKPTQMLAQINKWSGIIAFFYAVIIGEAIPTLIFSIYHPLQAGHIFLYGFLNFIGQIFVYRLIKQFKQHIVPMMMTTRRIFTIIVSLIFFHHKTAIGQIVGIGIVFLVSTVEFILSVRKDQPIVIQEQQIKPYQMVNNNNEALLVQERTKQVNQLKRQNGR